MRQTILREDECGKNSAKDWNEEKNQEIQSSDPLKSELEVI